MKPRCKNCNWWLDKGEDVCPICKKPVKEEGEMKYSDIKPHDPTLTEREPSECLTNPDYWQEQSDRGEKDCFGGEVAHGLTAGFKMEEW